MGRIYILLRITSLSRNFFRINFLQNCYLTGLRFPRLFFYSLLVTYFFNGMESGGLYSLYQGLCTILMMLSSQTHTMMVFKFNFFYLKKKYIFGGIRWPLLHIYSVPNAYIDTEHVIHQILMVFMFYMCYNGRYNIACSKHVSRLLAIHQPCIRALRFLQVSQFEFVLFQSELSLAGIRTADLRHDKRMTYQ